MLILIYCFYKSRNVCDVCVCVGLFLTRNCHFRTSGEKLNWEKWYINIKLLNKIKNLFQLSNKSFMNLFNISFSLNQQFNMCLTNSNTWNANTSDIILFPPASTSATSACPPALCYSTSSLPIIDQWERQTMKSKYASEDKPGCCFRITIPSTCTESTPH